MHFILSWAIYAVSAAVLAWAGFRATRNEPVILKQLWLALAGEVLLLAQTVLAAVLLLGNKHDVDGALFWGYQVSILLFLPIAAAVAFAERTKWSSVVMAGAAITVAVLQWRLGVIWA